MQFVFKEHVATMGVLVVCFILVAVFVGVIASNRRRAWEQKMIAEGKGAYYVKVAASNRGSVYHDPSCSRCRSTTVMTPGEAREAGYLPCSVCGGSPKFYLESDLR